MTEEPFKLDEADQNVLNQASLMFENISMRRQLIVTQLLLKHKDKNLRFDPNTGQFYIITSDVDLP
jgi:hypothetical protein